ncbi:hypothetical protein [Acidiplasma cupricumulans]|nr:hypothetical protein [Acidiplasma cupricumulans]
MALRKASIIDNDFYISMKNKNIIDIFDKLPDEAKKYVRKMMSKHEIPSYEYRKLNQDEIQEVRNLINEFDSSMGTKNIKYLDSKFTVITPRY